MFSPLTSACANCSLRHLSPSSRIVYRLLSMCLDFLENNQDHPKKKGLPKGTNEYLLCRPRKCTGSIEFIRKNW